MKRQPFVVPTLARKRSPKALAISVVIHAVALVVLSAILVQTPVGRMIGLRLGKPIPQERVTYIEVAPAPGIVGADTGAAAAVAPDALPPRTGPSPRPVAPTGVPQGVAPSQQPAAPGGVPGGTGGGGGAGGTSPGTGMVPSFSDARVWAAPGEWPPLPKSPRQVVDSVIDVAVGAYIDSVAVAAANQGREPGDWTFGKGDTKWGVDDRWIHFGKVKVPTALLAMLPINAQANPSWNSRERAATRWDIDFHAQRSLTEDEFRKSVKRIRERVERERAERRGADQTP